MPVKRSVGWIKSANAPQPPAVAHERPIGHGGSNLVVVIIGHSEADSNRPRRTIRVPSNRHDRVRCAFADSIEI